MKNALIRTLLLFSVFICTSVNAGKTLIAYEGNAHVHLLLFETDNPQNIEASASEDSASSYKNLGNPGNLAFFDSPPKLLAFALEKLMGELPTENTKISALEVDHFGVFIAGYDFFHDAEVCEKATGIGYVKYDIRKRSGNAGVEGECLLDESGKTKGLESKEAFFWRSFNNEITKLNISLQSSHNVLSGDHHLLTEAARENPDIPGSPPLENVDVVQLTTCAVGYQVREGKLVKDSSVSPDTAKHGGTFQVGSDLCSKYLKPHVTPFKVDQSFEEPVLEALNNLPVSKQYAQTKNDNILNRWKEKFVNEKGLAVIQILSTEEAPPGISRERWINAREQLFELVVDGPDRPRSYSALSAVIQVIEKLKKRQIDGLANNIEVPIRLLGDFPWYQSGMAVFFREELSPETSKHVEFIVPGNYEKMLAMAGQRILHPPSPRDGL